MGLAGGSYKSVSTAVLHCDHRRGRAIKSHLLIILLPFRKKCWTYIHWHCVVAFVNYTRGQNICWPCRQLASIGSDSSLDACCPPCNAVSLVAWKHTKLRLKNTWRSIKFYKILGFKSLFLRNLKIQQKQRRDIRKTKLCGRFGLWPFWT